jgi:hypothetical protein
VIDFLLFKSVRGLRRDRPAGPQFAAGSAEGAAFKKNQ